MEGKLHRCLSCNILANRRTVYRHRKFGCTSKRKFSAIECYTPTPSELDSDSDSDVNATSSNMDTDSVVPDTNAVSLEASDHNRTDEDDLDLDNQQYQWSDEDEDEIEMDINESNSGIKETQGHAKSLINFLCCSILFLQCEFNLSNYCVEKILFLFHKLLVILSHMSRFCSFIVESFPTSLYLLRKITNLDRDDFVKYVTCPNCTAIFKYTDIVKERNGRTVVYKCSNMVFGCRVDKNNENRGRKGKYQCGATLVKEIKLASGKVKYYPIKVYCYKSVIDSIQHFISRKGFLDSCNKWQDRRSPDDAYGDIFDGDIWKTFQNVNGQSFLSQPNNLAVMINVDWFQPYKRRRDKSVGVIYLVFMNLPRHLRFKSENVLLLGIIPALEKEPASLNSFLKPFIDEMKFLYKGFDFMPYGYDENIKIKVLLLCASSDIPAARKLGGFMGHGAICGCSICDIEFRNSEGERYCGPVDPSKWNFRTRNKHLKFADRALKAETLTKKSEIEKKYGYRYTQLLELPYFEPTKFSVVEPMHNLFLGTAKRLFSHWIDSQILTKVDLEIISSRVSKMNVSADIGRLPSNISSNYGQFTADEWKNWVLLYSLYALKGLLPDIHMKVWQTFVLACHHIVRTFIHSSNLRIADRLFAKFFNEALNLYGPSFMTPNMHLHGHLSDCIKMYGSIYGFWAFSFERYNGMLADFPSNKRSIEIQIMRKFQQLCFTIDMKFQELGEYTSEFVKFVGDKSHTITNIVDGKFRLAATFPFHKIEIDLWSDLSKIYKKHESYSLLSLTFLERSNLLQMYSKIYSKDISIENLATVVKKIPSLYYGNELFSSSASSRHKNYHLIMAKWSNDSCQVVDSDDIRPGHVKYFIEHVLEMNGKLFPHIFAVVDWFKRSNNNYGFLHPLTVWLDKFHNDGPASFIPIQRVLSRCAWVTHKQGQQKFIIVSPVPDRIFI